MQRAITETNRRRELQLNYNAEHNITPESVRSAVSSGIDEEIASRKIVLGGRLRRGRGYGTP